MSTKFLVAFLLTTAVWADVSLVLPGFDPQPLSAEIIGVGADNMTTYLLVPGKPTGTFSDQAPAFTGTATLVENANNVVFEYANTELTVIESCTYASGIADCAVVLGGPGATTGTAQDTVTPLLVQGGGTASSVLPTPTVSATTTSGSSVPATGSATGAGPTQTNGGERVQAWKMCGMVVVVLGVALLL